MKKQFIRYCSNSVKKSVLRQYPTAVVNLNTVAAVRLGGGSDSDDRSIVFVSKEPWGENIHIRFNTQDLAKKELVAVTDIMEQNGMNISKYKGSDSDINVDRDCVIL